MESRIEDVGDTIDDIRLLFEVNNSFITTVIYSCTSAQQGTLCLLVPALGDDFLTDISSLFVESHKIDLEDFFDDIHLLFVEDDPSIVVARDYSDPNVHSLHDQSSLTDVIVDTYVQQLSEVSLSVEETVGSLR